MRARIVNARSCGRNEGDEWEDGLSAWMLSSLRPRLSPAERVTSLCCVVRAGGCALLCILDGCWEGSERVKNEGLVLLRGGPLPWGGFSIEVGEV